MSENPNPYGQPTKGSYAQPAYGAPVEDPGKTLGIIGLVLCFVFSLAGLIISIIAKKKSEAAGFTDNTPAKVGVILGWIFTILGVIGAVIYVILIIAIINSGTSLQGY